MAISEPERNSSGTYLLTYQDGHVTPAGAQVRVRRRLRSIVEPLFHLVIARNPAVVSFPAGSRV